MWQPTRAITLAKSLNSSHIVKHVTRPLPVLHTQVAHKVQKLIPVTSYPEIEFPEQRRKLKVMEKVPPPDVQTLGTRKPVKMKKQLMYMRGPELVNTELKHKQYGIKAIMGGQLHHGHFEMIRNGINKKLDEKRMFAIWRIDPPWKPLTKKGIGHRMGGGKGSISKYVSPIKAGRIIIEVGGYCDYEEVYPFLKIVAAKLPFKAEPVSQKLLEYREREQRFIEENNINPFSFEYALKNNYLGSQIWASPYDYIWHGKHR